MTKGQKLIAVLGLIAIASTLVAAPHSYTGSAVVTGRNAGLTRAEGTIHLAVWAEPDRGIWVKASDVDAVLPDSIKREFVVVDRVRLDTGRLGLWWAGIAMVTVVAMVVAAPPPSRERHA